MQITENMLLSKLRHGCKTTYEGLLLPNLQPVLYVTSEGSRSCIYFSQFGNNFFIRPWNCEQDRIDNIVKLGEASHKIIKNDEVEFLLAYNEIEELTLNFLYDLKTTKRCTFILSIENLQKVINSIDTFSSKFKKRIRTYQYKEDNNKSRDNYIFTISLYSIDTIVANLKNKELDGVGIAIEVFNKQYTQHYKTPYVSYGCYLVFTNTSEDVLYRDCVEILPQSSFDPLYIHEQISNYARYCKNNDQSNAMEDYLKSISPSIKTEYKIASKSKIKKLFEEDVPIPPPAEAPPQMLHSYDEDLYALDDLNLEYTSEIKQDSYARYKAELQSAIPISEPVPVPASISTDHDVVDADIEDVHTVVGKKIRGKNIDDLWISLRDVPQAINSLKGELEKTKSFEEYKQEKLKKAKKASKEALYKKLYSGSLKAVQEEMIAEISEEIVEKQKRREQAKPSMTTSNYYVSTSDTTAYTGVGFGTIKYTMN